MPRADVLAELDRFQGRPPAAAPPLQISRGPTDGRVLCLRPKTGLPDGEPLSVEVEDEDRRRWLARRVDRNGRQARETSEYPKYAWEKVRDGFCPVTVVQRLPRPVEDRRIAIAAETQLDQQLVVPKPEAIQFQGVTLTQADRVLVWLYQNRGLPVTVFSAPKEISVLGIVGGVGLERVVVSQRLGQLEQMKLVQRTKRRVTTGGRLVIDTWTLTPQGFTQVDLRVRGGVYPSRLPPVEAVPELVLRRAGSLIRSVGKTQSQVIRDLVQAQEDLRSLDRQRLADRVEQAELNVRRAQMDILPVLEQLGGKP
jgi:hypothetical protein